MRVLVDLVDSFTGMVRFIIVAVMVVGFGLAVILTAGVSYVAPKVAEGATERAAQIGERAIDEARQAQRDHDLAQEGWGYGSADGSQSRVRNSGSRSSGGFASDGGDWGNEAQ